MSNAVSPRSFKIAHQSRLRDEIAKMKAEMLNERMRSELAASKEALEREKQAAKEAIEREKQAAKEALERETGGRAGKTSR